VIKLHGLGGEGVNARRGNRNVIAAKMFAHIVGDKIEDIGACVHNAIYQNPDAATSDIGVLDPATSELELEG